MKSDKFVTKTELLDFLDDKAEELRKEVIRLAAIAGSGHVGGGLSMAEIIVALYYHAMNLKAGDYKWPERDRFVLSKGHGAIAYYPVLADLGFFPKDWLETFNLFDSPFGMHPDMKKIPGVEMSTGSLGHGLSVGVGMALTARIEKAQWRVYVLLGDGEISEGLVWEAAQSASNYKLGNLTAVIDRNGLSYDGPTEKTMSIEPIRERWEAFGWKVTEVDGHDMEQLVDAFDSLPPVQSEVPNLVIAHTVKGKGVDFMENIPIWHNSKVDIEKAEKAWKSIHANRPARRVEK